MAGQGPRTARTYQRPSKTSLQPAKPIFQDWRGPQRKSVFSDDESMDASPGPFDSPQIKLKPSKPKVEVASDDPFDQLLGGDAFDQLAGRRSGARGKENLANWSDNTSLDQSSKSAATPGLFNSITEEKVMPKLEPRPRLKSRKSSKPRLKSTRLVVKEEQEATEVKVLSETLELVDYIKFEEDARPYLASPAVGKRRLSTIHSTPNVVSTASLGAGHPDMSAISPVRQAEGGAAAGEALTPVTRRRSSPEGVSSPAAPPPIPATPPAPPAAALALDLNSSLQDEDVFEATPQKSFVNQSRGVKKFGGAAASLFRHFGHQGTLLPSQAGSVVVVEAEVPEVPEVPGTTEGNEVPEPTEEADMPECTAASQLHRDVTVRMGCICGIAEDTADQLIMCERCTFHFHTSCMALGATAIAEVVEDLLRWFCPACRRFVEDQDASSFDLASGEAVDTRSSGMVDQDVDQDVEEGAEVEQGGAGDASETGLSRLLGRARLSTGGEHSPSSVNDHSSGVTNLCTTASSIADTSSTSTYSGTRRCLGATPAGGCAVSPGANSSPTKEPSLLSSPSSIEESSLPCSPSTKESFHSPPATKEAPFSPKEQAHLSSSTIDKPSLSSPTTKDSSVSSTPSTPHMKALTPPSTPAPREALNSTAEVLALAALQDTMSPLPFFATPSLPVWKKPRPKLELAASPGLAAKPGKAWRRSIAVAAKADSKVPGAAPRPSLAASRSSFYVVPRPLPVPAVEEVPEVVVDEVEDAEDAEERRLLMACQEITFNEVYSEDVMKGSVKVGEGAFGEVFKIGDKEDSSVLKVVPFGGDIAINEEKQTAVPDIISEVTISVALSALRRGQQHRTDGFVEVRRAGVFRGDYPDHLLVLWDQFEQEKGTENERPDKLGADQRFLALEFNNAGRDLEKFVFGNASQAFQAWKQVAHSLAVAEEQLGFEHRDLHWGNVLIKEVKAGQKVEYRLGGDLYEVATEGVVATIIDFSLSRAVVDGQLIYNNLAEDPSVFQGRGKEQKGGDYQFDIYRMVKKDNGNQWDGFRPKSNVFWLHYMLDKMTTAGQVLYKGKKTARPHKSGLAKMKALKGKMLEYDSARQWVIREGDRVD